MVISYFNLFGISVFPHKANSPFIVDPNAVLSPAIPLQWLEPVAGRDAQVFEFSGGTDLLQFSDSYLDDLGKSSVFSLSP